MLTIKNRGGRKSIFFLLSLGLLLAGCAPPGARALLKGKRLIEAGRYSEAIEQLNLATSLLPTNAQAWNYLGLACQNTGQSTNAQRAYLLALKCDPDLSEAHYNLGCLWLSQNRTEAAKSEFTTYTLRRANSPEGFVKLGTAELLAAKTGTAAARSRELDAAEHSLNEALRLNPQNPEALNTLGLVKLHRGRPTEAVQCFNTALRQQPGYAPAQLNLAIASQQYLHDQKSALQQYRQYLNLKPTPEDADAVKAVVGQLERELAKQGRPNPSVAASAPGTGPHTTNAARPSAAPNRPATESVAAKLSPAPASSKPNPVPGTTASANTETVSVSADPVFRVAQDVSPGSAPVPESSVESFSSASKSPGRYRYHAISNPLPGNRSEAQHAFDAGLQAQRENRLPDAIQAYHRAEQLDPSFYEAHYNLALAAAAMGDVRSSLAAYEQALAARPDSPEARYNFALMLKQANFPADAANELEKLVSIHPEQARAHLALGNLYSQQLHEPARARHHYLKFLEANPNDPQVGAIRSWLASNL